MKLNFFVAALAFGITATSAFADDHDQQQCSIPKHDVQKIQSQLADVVKQDNGGLFSPNRMWSAVVDRKGVLCDVIKIGDAWPGSRVIAIAKAGTANDFSNDALALSTANLYVPTQPGGSLYGLDDSNPFNPAYLAQGTGIGKVPGGVITFGGGVPLYWNGKVIGGLGVSGDSACADHAIAYRMRHQSGLDITPGGVAPGNTDNIIYADVGTTPSGYQHPHCDASTPSKDITP